MKPRPKCGTASGYKAHRYRDEVACRRCKAAVADYEYNLRRTREPLSPRDRRHGTVNGYCNYRCRCDRCRAAWRDYQRTLAA